MRSSRDGARSTRWRSPACANGWPASARRIPALSPQARPCDFWAVSQEMGADFAMGLGLLGGCRRESFAVELADLGKRRRIVAFRAGSACETAQKFAVHRRSSRAAAGQAAAARRAGYVGGFLTGAHEALPRSCGVLMMRWMLGRFMAVFWLWCPEKCC